ncbi:(d)CMP kinase [Spirochaetota bacterium]
MKKKIIIAIDGPAGSGKSSVAKEVAVKCALKYIDSGAIYRSITWYVLSLYKEITPELEYMGDLENVKIIQEFMPDSTTRTFLNDRDISELIRNEIINKNIGVISDHIGTRNYVNALLRKWSENESIIMDGRDIGSVVFPDADLKIFLDASVEVRSARRTKEYGEMGKKVDENGIKKQIIQRDKQDRSRSYGTLVQTDDAEYIDTSNMTKDEVIGKIESLVNELLI